MAALNIKNIPTGPGDDIKVDASWAKGDTKNVIATSGTSPSFAMFGGTSAAYQSVGFGLTTRCGLSSGRHRRQRRLAASDRILWRPRRVQPQLGPLLVVQPVRQLLGRSLRRHGEGSICANYTTAGKAVGGVIAFTCNPDFNVSQLGVITRWTPVKNLTFSAEVQWFHLDQKFSGVATLGPSAPKPSTVYEFKDQDAVHLQVRAQRNF